MREKLEMNKVGSFDVSFHKFLVKVAADGVVDEDRLLDLVRLSLCTVLEHHIVVPTSGDLKLHSNIA